MAMLIEQHAKNSPTRPAIIMGLSGQSLTFSELNERSLRLARLLYDRGLRWGDHIAIMMENNLEYMEICWAAQRCGLHFTPVNWHLAAEEAIYVIDNCDAKAFFTSVQLKGLAADLVKDIPKVECRFMVGDNASDYEDYETAVATSSAELPKDAQHDGAAMVYSSGSTGRPKGVMRPLIDGTFGGMAGFHDSLRDRYNWTEESVYLSPAPWYHSAPLNYSMGSINLGTTVVCMENYDANECLRIIQDYTITHAQFVPTMFVRMLKLDKSERLSYDISSLEMVVHAAAPCPVDVKQQMLDWWGPIIHEYYAGSEGVGGTFIGPDEWLAHPGSVGRPEIVAHIVDDDGNDVGASEVGTIYFETVAEFQYHKDAEKTASVYNEQGWGTLGDIGYLDDEGYLYLTDRKANMIISGGVNIYPQETENCLTMHPKVLDVAVIGVPNEDFGEEVKAIIQPVDFADAGPALEEELIDYCRSKIAHYKCPRSVEFSAESIRLESGKLVKRRLQEVYGNAPKH